MMVNSMKELKGKTVQFTDKRDDDKIVYTLKVVSYRLLSPKELEMYSRWYAPNDLNSPVVVVTWTGSDGSDHFVVELDSPAWVEIFNENCTIIGDTHLQQELF